MTTLTKNLHSETHVYSTVNTSAYDRFIERIKFSHFGLISMAILIGSCLGGIATMKIFENNAPLWQFIVSLGITMANLVACIAQAPTKWVVNLFGASLIVNIILLLANIL